MDPCDNKERKILWLLLGFNSLYVVGRTNGVRQAPAAPVVRGGPQAPVGPLSTVLWPESSRLSPVGAPPRTLQGGPLKFCYASGHQIPWAICSLAVVYAIVHRS